MTPLPERFLTLPIAHRGLHDVDAGRPENSLSAIRAAVSAGYGVEIDIQCSSDGQAMVFHDYDLARLTPETGPVRQRTSTQLQRICLNGSNETIPTLTQVMAEVAGQTPVLVEIKDQDGALGADVGTLERAIAADVQDYPGEVAVMSFNPHSVFAMSQYAPSIPRGLVTGSFPAKNWQLIPATILNSLRDIPDFDRTDCSFISHRVDDLESPRAANIRAAGAPVLCWTVRNKSTETRARNFADNFTFEGYLPEIGQT